MPLIQITVQITVDGTPASFSPIVKSVQVAQAEAFASIKAGGDTGGVYTTMPGTDLPNPLQVLVATSDQAVRIMAGAATAADGIIALNANGLLVLVNANQDAGAGDNIEINNTGANAANLVGLSGGT